MKRVYVSLPVNRSAEEIEPVRDAILQAISEMLKEDVECVGSYDCGDLIPICTQAERINHMAMADYAAFFDVWSRERESIIERVVAEAYGIEVLMVSRKKEELTNAE